MPGQLKTIWCVTDEKPGHKNQMVGLSRALEQLSGANTHFLSLPILSSTLPTERPDLILCAGHRTHIPALKLKWRYKTPIAVLMKPSLPRCLFNFCIVPEHDGLKPSRRVITTLGAINAVQAATSADPKQGLILIGGPSKHFTWDNKNIATQINKLIESRPEMQWTLSDSRRTPDDFAKDLGSIVNLDSLVLVPFANQTPGWLQAHYQSCSEIWVSIDSVSMLYEALTTGSRVGALTIAIKAPNKTNTAITNLLKTEQICTTENLSNDPIEPRKSLNESLDAAKALIARL